MNTPMGDDELHSRLRAADPAAGLPPEDPAQTARLVEDVMSTELTEENRETGLRHRGRLTWLVAAAAVVVIALGAVVAVRAVDTDDPGPVADPATEPSNPASVTTLTLAAGGGTERCMVPNAETLATADVAVEGTVAEVGEDRATLTASHWYAGDPTDRVEVILPTEQPQRLDGQLELRRGGHYLLAASDGKLYTCGMSGPTTERLAALYRDAFAG